MQTIIMDKSRKFDKEILSHFRKITIFVGDIFLSAPCMYPDKSYSSGIGYRFPGDMYILV